MGLPPSSVSPNAACPSEPLLCLLDRTGPRGDSVQGPSEAKAEGYFVCLYGGLKGQFGLLEVGLDEACIDNQRDGK